MNSPEHNKHSTDQDWKVLSVGEVLVVVLPFSFTESKHDHDSLVDVKPGTG